ncbi:hypothetical protein WL05_29185 [Burkholderia ubonensis]|nr:hypothetical protein WJ52_13110 [Burkholderia ubonensis]KVM18788.1 hypothetical protein WJ51_06975 [Burkholderia ubonensis]KVM42276.1 hypothetical protein WJ56_30815 [Burkholderia ubonensis]KVM86123.1 hypothetical protein WJ60_19795 [Burkholderia ubonensis]KVT77438.1 hypothetical protein WK56_00960 [Burkholderia ubonensis]
MRPTPRPRAGIVLDRRHVVDRDTGEFINRRHPRAKCDIHLHRIDKRPLILSSRILLANGNSRGC